MLKCTAGWQSTFSPDDCGLGLTVDDVVCMWLFTLNNSCICAKTCGFKSTLVLNELLLTNVRTCCCERFFGFLLQILSVSPAYSYFHISLLLHVINNFCALLLQMSTMHCLLFFHSNDNYIYNKAVWLLKSNHLVILVQSQFNLSVKSVIFMTTDAKFI